MSRIQAIMISGTIAQKANSAGEMSVALSLADLMKDVSSDHRIDEVDTHKRSGAELTFDVMKEVAEKIRNGLDDYDGFLVIAGTDSLEELAFYLDLAVESEKPIVVTGAMRPADLDGYDGIANLKDSCRVLASPEAAGKGVLLVMNGEIHAARHVRKMDAQALGAFVSVGGPVGYLRRGLAIFHLSDLPAMRRYGDVDLEGVGGRIPIVVMCAGTDIEGMDVARFDGLILAGMGTGSIPLRVVDALAPRWTRRIPIVIASRCLFGNNYDDHVYRGSLEKYEGKGFLLRGYEEVSAVQARIKLAFELAVMTGKQKRFDGGLRSSGKGNAARCSPAPGWIAPLCDAPSLT